MQQFLTTKFVASPQNEEALKVIDAAIKTPGSYATLFVFGPRDCGKTTLVNSYETGRDLLSSRKTTIIHPHMLVLMLTTLLDRSEDALGDLAETDVLIVDSFDDAFAPENKEIAPQALTRLIAVRCKQRLSTIIFARSDLKSYADTEVWPSIKGMQQIALEPLDLEGRMELFRQIQERETANVQNPRTFSPDTIRFLAETFEDDLAYGIKGAVVTLHSSAYSEGAIITEEMLREANK